MRVRTYTQEVLIKYLWKEGMVCYSYRVMWWNISYCEHQLYNDVTVSDQNDEFEITVTSQQGNKQFGNYKQENAFIVYVAILIPCIKVASGVTTPFRKQESLIFLIESDVLENKNLEKSTLNNFESVLKLMICFLNLLTAYICFYFKI